MDPSAPAGGAEARHRPRIANFPAEFQQIIAQSGAPGNSKLNGLARIVHGTARDPQLAFGRCAREPPLSSIRRENIGLVPQINCVGQLASR
jgi:hypothetical protein